MTGLASSIAKTTRAATSTAPSTTVAAIEEGAPRSRACCVAPLRPLCLRSLYHALRPILACTRHPAARLLGMRSTGPAARDRRHVARSVPVASDQPDHG